MNPLRWLLKKSEELAYKRGGTPLPREERATFAPGRYEPQHTEVDGAHLLIMDPMWKECWSAFSNDRSRYVRVVETHDGSFRLNGFVRVGREWQQWEGSSVLASQSEAEVLGGKLLGLPI